MEPSARLVLLTTQKINQYLKNQNQSKSFISELWVFNALRNHLQSCYEVDLPLTEEEMSDRVATIAIRRIRANIVTEERFQREWPSLLSRPHQIGNSNFGQTEIAQLPSRGEISIKQQKYDGKIEDRQIEIKD